MAFRLRLPEWKSRKEHEYYAELCALLTSGSLTYDELRELNAHLRVCKSCSRLLASYRAVSRSVTTLAPATEEPPLPQKPAWVENAWKRLLNSIEADRATLHPQLVYERPSMLWHRLKMFRTLAATAVLLLAAVLAGFSYRLGQVRGRQAVQQSASPQGVQKPESADWEALSRQRSALEEQLAARSSEMTRLEHELQLQMAAIAEAKASQDKLERNNKEQSSSLAALGLEKTALAGERDAVLRRLQETQDALAATQQRLDSLQAEHSRQLLRTASLQTRVDELSASLKESDETVRRAERFLVSDRDIRDLMGARDLYIADVFDIDREGKTQQPFGRVFYTAGKSLIFYAFDLDRQPGVHNATFQAWGRRGPGDKRPLNMGVLYLDNAANKRWALRFDDPKALNEIDAMFVTVEPRGGGQKPSGKQLLFASLRTPPNHP